MKFEMREVTVETKCRHEGSVTSGGEMASGKWGVPLWERGGTFRTSTLALGLPTHNDSTMTGHALVGDGWQRPPADPR